MMIAKRGFFGKEDAALLLQLLNTTKELTVKLEKYYATKDIEKFENTKREILRLYEVINEKI